MPSRRSTPASATRPERPLWAAVLLNVLIALAVVSLVQATLVRVHNVSSGSMETTLGVTDRVLSSKLPYLRGGPQRGDIVIFAHGEDWSDAVREPDPNPVKQLARTVGDVTGIGISNRFYTVKRVIGVPGDIVECCTAEGRLLVNHEPVAEPYVFEDLAFRAGELDCSTAPRSARCFRPITVPEGKLLVLGDHRSNSADSVIECRHEDAAADCARFVDAERVSGKVIGRVFPPGPVR